MLSHTCEKAVDKLCLTETEYRRILRHKSGKCIRFECRLSFAERFDNVFILFGCNYVKAEYLAAEVHILADKRDKRHQHAGGAEHTDAVGSAVKIDEAHNNIIYSRESEHRNEQRIRTYMLISKAERAVTHMLKSKGGSYDGYLQTEHRIYDRICM